MADSADVIDIFKGKPDLGLEALNRLTGLDWGQLPQPVTPLQDEADYTNWKLENDFKEALVNESDFTARSKSHVTLRVVRG